jgi:hypothetical protein
MDMKLKYLLYMFLFLFISCGDEGDFKPNNLISVSDDYEAEAELARLTGAPVMDSIAIINDIYTTGEVITITTEWSKRMLVDTSGGTPRLALSIGGNTRYANYSSGDTTFFITFTYTVVAGDLDGDGIGLPSDVDFNSGVLKDYSDQEALTELASFDASGVIIDSTGASISVNSGDTYTNNTTTNLTVSAAGVTDMYITETSGCSGGGAWQAYATNPTFGITANGNRTVYIKFRNASGGESQCYNDSIIHDSLAPDDIVGISASGDGSDIASATTSWAASSDNGLSGIDHYEMAVSTSTSEAAIVGTAPWTDVGTNTTYQFNQGNSAINLGTGTYYTLLKAVDNAGNESNVVSSAPWTITLSPEKLLSLSMVNRGTDFIRIGWAYPVDNGTPIVDYQIQYKENSGDPWSTINDGVSTSRRYTHNGLVDDENYFYRVRAYNGSSYGAWSDPLEVSTLPDIDFFNAAYQAINVGGATANQLVSFADGNTIYKDGVELSTINKGDTLSIPATDFTKIEGTEPFFIAGRLGAGGNTNKANVVWATSAWVGNEFYFNHNRSNPMKVKVYAFTDSNVSITSGGAPVSSQFIASENGHTFTISSYGSYEMSSDGLIVAYTYANGNGTQYVDPKPLLPASKDIIGFASSSAKITSSTDGNAYTRYFSNNTSASGTINTGTTLTFNGSGNRYSGNSVRLKATQNIIGNSYADADGNCSAPFVPSAFQKKKFGLNVMNEWVAFASTNAASITVTEPGGATSTINLTKTGTNTNTPYRAYRTTDYPAGTLFESSDAFQMWYEPKNDTNAANDDETVMFGWD